MLLVEGMEGFSMGTHCTVGKVKHVNKYEGIYII